jgi:hypothetical protein
MKAKSLIEAVGGPREFLRGLGRRTRFYATFHPQAWFNDWAVDADPEGPITWDVTDYLMQLSPEKRDAALEPDTYDSDYLRLTPNAPQWVKEWQGPFYVSVKQTPP